jgi:hypothetical protein
MEEHRSRVFENRVLRGIFGYKTELPYSGSEIIPKRRAEGRHTSWGGDRSVWSGD